MYIEYILEKVINQALWMKNNMCKTSHVLFQIANFFFDGLGPGEYGSNIEWIVYWNDK